MTDRDVAELAYALTVEEDSLPVSHVLVHALDALAYRTPRRGSVAQPQLIQAPRAIQRAVIERLIYWAF